MDGRKRDHRLYRRRQKAHACQAVCQGARAGGLRRGNGIRHGRMRERYLKEHRRAAYTELKLSDRLDGHLAEIDQTCNERMGHIAKQMAEREGVTEALKASDQMAWIGAMNNFRSRAEENVLTEVVYA